jgi:hypothetical protein
VVAAAIGGGNGFELRRCRGVEHEVHDHSFPKYSGSLAHEFNGQLLSGWVEGRGLFADPKRAVVAVRFAVGCLTIRVESAAFDVNRFLFIAVQNPSTRRRKSLLTDHIQAR